MKRIGIYSGSFDPITNGHLWVIEEGKKLFDELHVLIGPVAKKEMLFTPAERKAMIEQVVKPPVIVDILYTGNILAYVKKLKGDISLLRGIRSESDFKYESEIASCIRAAGGQCHLLFVIPPADIRDISSTSVKFECGCGHWMEVERNVPINVVSELMKVYREKRKTFVTAAEISTLYPEPVSIFETTTAGFAPAPCSEEEIILLLSNNGHKIEMVDELETILDKLGNNKVTIQFFGKMRDNFKQLEANGFIKFADWVTSEQVRMMLDPCHLDVVSSDTYSLSEIPLHSVKPLGNGRYLPCSQSLGPIIVDLKPKDLQWSDLPPVVVIEGKHRWLDAEERGDKKIMAYVGNKALKYFRNENAD